MVFLGGLRVSGVGASAAMAAPRPMLRKKQAWCDVLGRVQKLFHSHGSLEIRGRDH